MPNQMTITLSEKASLIVQARIDRGDFADAQAAVESALQENGTDDEIETWLRDVVAVNYAALDAGTMPTYSAAQVRERLSQHAASFDTKTAA
jgi:Arc/MetJ-type ribon-helix-helix transcriptional regulator